MKSYQVTRKDGATGTISAASFVTDGAGTRFYDADGGVVASFNDGAIASVLDASVVFAMPEAVPDEPAKDGKKK
ncbi:hypothetical protein [Pseudorhodobacter sp.]|uniref:hypothetical protein n=1 Tax=Pseudorhodobacter sp. TaxID=1934400 RepID=UPI0026484885|nr:hypothetical protein [Pseudorhodobacter sp.]MDN5789224.1 hypothetical protein [Pseudorhodobacter sp.]